MKIIRKKSVLTGLVLAVFLATLVFSPNMQESIVYTSMADDGDEEDEERDEEWEDERDEEDDEDEDREEVYETVIEEEEEPEIKYETVTRTLPDTVVNTTVEVPRYDRDGDGIYDDEDPHPDINELLIVKDDNFNGIDDRYER